MPIKLPLSAALSAALFFAGTAFCPIQAQMVGGSAQSPGSTANLNTSPVQWSAAIEENGLHPGEFGTLLVTARIAAGTWHIYSLTQPPGGPVRTTISLQPAPGIKAVGSFRQPPPASLPDANFPSPSGKGPLMVEEFKHSVTFWSPFQVDKTFHPGPIALKIDVLYQVCNDRNCYPPAPVQLTARASVAAGPVRADHRQLSTITPRQPLPETAAITGAVGSHSAVGSGGVSSRERGRDINARIRKAESGGLLAFILLAFTMGFAALATPCVFAMIPITVSLFTKHEDGTGGSNLKGALVYCLGIMATFTGLGLALAGVFRASGIAQFAANPWVNLVIALIFAVLAANLMGYFEIMAPAALVNRTSSLSSEASVVGILLMALTFTLTSFTCTVPFVGSLLVSASQGDWGWPILGMLAFSSAFALPFFLLALFPRLLGRLPRSGGWLVSVKAFMGFLELAAAVKFLSNADLVWQAHIVTRGAFLAAWAIVSLLSALYLLGQLRLPHDHPAVIGPGRKVLAVVMLLAGGYCVAAMLGSPLGDLDAYVPPVGYEFGRLEQKLEAGGHWYNNLDEARKVARLSHRPIFVDFTGYTCTNCRWMESNIFSRPEIRSELSRYVLVQLYTDCTRRDCAINRTLEQDQFGTIALPYYAAVDSDGRVSATFPGLTRNASEFAAFLRDGQAGADLP